MSEALKAMLFFIIFGTLTSQASAQVCSGIPGLVTNSGFEDPDITQPTPVPVASYGTLPAVARIYDASDIPGWETTSSDNNIEIWQTGHNSVTPYEGSQFAELNAFIAGNLYQDIATTPNSIVVWSFGHRGRSGVDQASVLIGPAGGTLVSQGVYSTGNTAWDLKTGTYTVPAGQTVTRFQFAAVSTASGDNSVGNFIDDVRLTPNCDYGDAPASYPVIRANNGAAHRVSIGAFLGAGIDAETDGYTSGGAALGDDIAATDDEDGVAFNPLTRGLPSTVDITASVPGYINLWIDLDQDGDWQAGERIFTDTPVVAGTQTLTITAPLSAIEGTSFARVRFSTDDPSGALNVGGDWANGEVEDYLVSITTLAAELQATKSVDVFDPLGEGLYAVPGNDVLYTIFVENIGAAPIDSDTIFLVDALHAEVEFYNGDADGPGPETDNIIFTTTDPNLTFDPAINAGFSNLSIQPVNFAACDYTPVSGYDPAVKFICFNPNGQLPASASSPSFSVSFRARIR